MARLTWDEEAKRVYETGTRQGVLYPKNEAGVYQTGVAWNGLTGVTESPSGAEETKLFADDIKYLSLRSAEEFGGTIEAYTYPDEWEQCDGSAELAPGVHIGQQPRRSFGLCYRTLLGNAAQGDSYGYKLHIVYNAMASPSEKSYATINDSPEAITFSWEFSTTPTSFGDDYKASSLLIIDSTKCDPDVLTAIENKLYGTNATEGTGGAAATEATDPTLPTPEWILSQF